MLHCHTVYVQELKFILYILIEQSTYSMVALDQCHIVLVKNLVTLIWRPVSSLSVLLVH